MSKLWKRIRAGKEPVLVANLVLSGAAIAGAIGYDVDAAAILAVLAALGVTTATVRRRVTPT